MRLLAQRRIAELPHMTVCGLRELTFKDVTVKSIMLSEILQQLLGNLSLLYHYLLLYCTESQIRATDLVLRQLTMANWWSLF